MLQCNCSIIFDEKSHDAIIIDPGDEAEKIQAELNSNHLHVKAVLHTHAHFDHIMATPMVATEDTKVGLHKDDLFLWDNLAMQGKLFGMKVEPMQLQISDWLEDEKSYAIGDHSPFLR